MGARHSQDQVWDRQVLIAIFLKDPSAWSLIQARSDWRTRQIGVHHWTVLHAAVWIGNSELEAVLRAQGIESEARDTCGDSARELASEFPLSSQETESTVDGKVHSPRCSPQLRL